MTVCLSPQAAREIRWLRKMGAPACGWLKGDRLGHALLVEALITRDLDPDSLEREYLAALEHLGPDLLGVFFAYRPIMERNWFRGDLVLRIQKQGVDACIVPAGEEPLRSGEFFAVPCNGDSHDEPSPDG